MAHRRGTEEETDDTMWSLFSIRRGCKRHVDVVAAAFKADNKLASTAATNDNLKAFDADFVKVDQATLFDLTLGF
ncbi:UNVERIFIED_CONTAM: SKP1-like protein 1A [Sesamum radiatum]|uniref:SKP1-like protein 1A n=1 Tax=Sesamum radiatum TaxID=300843 RepID=A0AAW2VQ15_SESRA